MESNNKANKKNELDNEVNEVAMNNIKKNLDGVISGYLEQFTKKFETFMGQMRIADILLKTFEYRYDKIQGKIGNINDVNDDNKRGKNKKIKSNKKEKSE